MTYTVFLSGSRKISRLNGEIRDRLQTIVEKDFQIIIGDANGADKAFQSYLAKIGYEHVIVFCSGDNCRNNIGSWQQKNIFAEGKLAGRDFYTVKDKAMAAKADYGFVVWDGKSAGSINNVIELLNNGRPSIVYFAPDKSFHAVKAAGDVEKMLKLVDANDYRNMNDKIHFDRRLKDLNSMAQGALTL